MKKDPNRGKVDTLILKIVFAVVIIESIILVAVTYIMHLPVK